MGKQLDLKDFLPEKGPDLISGTIAMDNASFTAWFGLHSGPQAGYKLLSVVLPESGSPQTFITESCWKPKVTEPAADSSCAYAT